MLESYMKLYIGSNIGAVVCTGTWIKFISTCNGGATRQLAFNTQVHGVVPSPVGKVGVFVVRKVPIFYSAPVSKLPRIAPPRDQDLPSYTGVVWQLSTGRQQHPDKTDKDELQWV